MWVYTHDRADRSVNRSSFMPSMGGSRIRITPFRVLCCGFGVCDLGWTFRVYETISTGVDIGISI